MAKCEEFETIEKQIKYLRFVLKERKNNPPEIDENVGLKPSFEEYIQNEIEFREKELELSTNTYTEAQEPNNDDLIWWKGSEGQLIYLFEQLTKHHFIDETFEERKYALLSRHFKNKKGKRYTNKQMSQAAQNLVMNITRKPRKAELLESIVTKLKEVD